MSNVSTLCHYYIRCKNRSLSILFFYATVSDRIVLKRGIGANLRKSYLFFTAKQFIKRQDSIDLFIGLSHATNLFSTNIYDSRFLSFSRHFRFHHLPVIKHRVIAKDAKRKKMER